MKRKQKTYNTEQSIIEEIDSAQSKLKSCLEQAEAKDERGSLLVRSGNREDVKEGGWLRNEADKLGAKANKLETKLQKLKGALAEFRTETLPGVIADKFDRQVVLK